MILSLKTLLCVGGGCFLGGVLRYLTSYVVCTRWGISATDMPWHTLLINFGGCLFMGLFCGLATAGIIESPNLRLALTAGLCGGYSTLAAFAFENTMLLRSGHYLTTGSYILATMLGSLAFFAAGYACANFLARS
ncbi:MAG: CrcB family protein [Akkermansia sp.]|nr:CrcB family protein [Akkermansia sp.]